MNMLIEKAIIEEMWYGNNLTYICNDANNFLPTEYKVLSNKANSCFVKCMKMTYNGKTQLEYFTSELKSLESMMRIIDAEKFALIVSHILENVMEVKKNGFLSCKKIDISLDKIYVDPTTYKVKMIYIPLNVSSYDDEYIFENELRTLLVKVITDYENVGSQKIKRLRIDLSNGMINIEELYESIKTGVEIKKHEVVENSKSSSEVYKKESGNICITSLNSPEKFSIDITKPEFVIGKKASMVDGVVSFNKMISRVHCKVLTVGSHVSVVDLKSANGTYINGVKLVPDTPYPVKNGDIIRMANSDFQIQIG